MHKLCKAQPPEFSSDKLASFEITGVTGSLVVMTVDKDGSAKGLTWGDIDMTFACDDVIVILPV